MPDELHRMAHHVTHIVVTDLSFLHNWKRRNHETQANYLIDKFNGTWLDFESERGKYLRSHDPPLFALKEHYALFYFRNMNLLKFGNKLNRY